MCYVLLEELAKALWLRLPSPFPGMVSAMSASHTSTLSPVLPAVSPWPQQGCYFRVWLPRTHRFTCTKQQEGMLGWMLLV